jgi:hypothetical protein
LLKYYAQMIALGIGWWFSTIQQLLAAQRVSYIHNPSALQHSAHCWFPTSSC